MEIMNNEPDKIKEAFQRCAKALSLRPALGLGSGVSTTTVSHGLTCKTQEGQWKFVVDMPEQAGGNSLGPTPGILGRAALGSCLAIGYMMRAATMNVLIKSLAVEVQADYDDGALFGVAQSPPGYLEVRYAVTVESDATEDEITKVLDEADAHSPYLDVFSRAQNCKRTVHILSAKSQ